MNNSNNNNSVKSSKLNLNFLEKRLYPLFNALPLEVPIGWMIPFLFFVEDLQFYQYIFSDFIYMKLRPFVVKIFTIFDPNIDSGVYFFVISGLMFTFIAYMYFMIFIHLKTDGGKTVSKKSLWIYNSIFNIVFKYMLSFVFCFFGRCMYICNYSDSIKGIPRCDETFNYIIRGVSVLCLILITAYNIVYCNFNFNTNCLSHGKYFGSIHIANTNKMGCVKLILALFKNYIGVELSTRGVSFNTILTITNVVLIVSFLYLAYSQLKFQPYYSPSVNNYRFAVFFSIGGFSLLTFFMCLLGINSSQFVCDIVPALVVILFILGYKLNDIYYKRTIKRIYKRFQEKQMISDLRKTTSKDELKLSPEKFKKKNVYRSVERITKEVYIKKEIKVYNNYFECDFACRFLRYNRSIEAFLLMKKLFEEGLIQFKHEADIYIMAWYYIHSMKKFYKENNLLNKFDIELFNGESILNNAMDLKLDMRKKYLINKALSYIEIEKRENSLNVDTQDVELSIKLEELKIKAVSTHILGLKEIKDLFGNLKNSTNTKDIASYSSNITNICKYQKIASAQYNSIIRQFPDAKDVTKVYILFLMDVMNKDEVAYRYSLGLQKMPDQNSTNEVSTKPLDKNNLFLNNNNSKEKKSLTASSNSLVSIPHSEDYSSTSGLGRELRKKIAAKASMTKKYIEPIKALKLKMTIFIILFVLVFSAQALVTIYMFNTAEKHASILSNHTNIPGAMKSATYYARLISYCLILGDMRKYAAYIGGTQGVLTYLDSINLESVSTYMDIEADSPLLEPVGKYAFDSYNVRTIAESYKIFLSNVKYVANRGPLSANETIYDILFEPHFKYFIVNSKSNFDLVFEKTKVILSDKIVNLFNSVNILLFSFIGILIVITLIIAYITFVPLKKATNKIIANTFKMFKYFSKENFEQVVTDYEEKIETLCENFDIDKEMADNQIKREKDRSFTNIKLIISFIIIIGYVIISGIPILQTANEEKNILSLLQKSADRLSIMKSIHLYTYEVINQDKSVFLDNEPERILNDYIYKIEKIQDELKSGSYGGPTFDDYPALDNVLKENGCHRLERGGGGIPCESMVYDSSYGFSEEIATLPINELIREYLYYLKNFISDVEDGDRYVRLPFTTKENVKIIYDQFLNDKFFKLQDGMMENISGDIQYINFELMNYAINLLESEIKIVIVLIVIGILIFIFMNFFIFNKLYKDKINEMNTLVSFLFLVPPTIVNKNEKYKRFLETTQTDE